MKEIHIIAAVAAALLALNANAQLNWTSMSAPTVVNPYGATAFSHLSDGRVVYAQSGTYYLQQTWGMDTFDQFDNQPAGSDPSFIAIHSDTYAVAGRGTGLPTGFDAFNPSDTTSAFTPTGSVHQNYSGTFRDSGSIYISGSTNDAGFWWDHAAITHLELDGGFSKTIIDNVSTYNGGITSDKYGNLYIGDADDNSVYKFTSQQLADAISGTALTIGDGEFIHQFDTTGSIAVDDGGNIWAAGFGVNGLQVYNPNLDREFNYIPGLANSDYQVATFTKDGASYVGYLNRASWNGTGNDAMTYGYAAIPEPASALFLAIGGAIFLTVRRNRKQMV